MQTVGVFIASDRLSGQKEDSVVLYNLERCYFVNK